MMAIDESKKVLLPFSEFSANDEKPEKEVNYSKTVIDGLYSIRRTLPENQRDLIAKINKAIDEIQTVSRLTTTDLEEMILTAIEKHMAWTLADISDDLELDRKTIRPVIDELHKKGLIRFVKRYIPRADKPNFLIKSNRVKEPDVA